jgi:hypothetical protein
MVACFATSSGRLSDMTVKELKERLKEEGLPTSGLKAELVERLSDHIASSIDFGIESSLGS